MFVPYKASVNWQKIIASKVMFWPFARTIETIKTTNYPIQGRAINKILNIYVLDVW